MNRNPTSAMLRAAGLGTVAGVRSMSAPALLSRKALRGAVPGIESTPFAALASPRVARALTLMAVGEAIADKFDFVPDRTSIPGLIGRAVSGAFVGAALFVSGGRRGTAGAALGLVSALAGSYPSYYLRTMSQEKLGAPHWALGLLEDALAQSVGLAALRR